MPALGRYDSRDRRVMRKHAEWLTDAGVDFIWLDWSNNVTYDPDEFLGRREAGFDRGRYGHPVRRVPQDGQSRDETSEDQYFHRG